ncbi:MAG: hypothetical protein DI566_07795 [Microbacterium sp.]|nr:MAG: hypothetical protein DI566_07795 [Microbacterium sp.]
MAGSTSADGTVAVISAYHPPSDLAGRAQELLDQVERVIVVDDGSDAVRTWEVTSSRLETIDLRQNRGIAGALNAGLERAAQLGARFALVLDQDSIVPTGYVERARAFMEGSLAAGSPVAAVAPALVEGDEISVISGGRPLDPIQSGQVILLAAFDKIGPLADDFVIDAVDSEYTLRARSAGYEIYLVPGLELGHSLGELRPLIVFGRHRRILGRQRYWRYHAPFRTYYMVRNGLLLWRRHRRGAVLWLMRRTAYLLVDVSYTSLASPDRRAQFVAAAHGFRDAVRGRSGRIAPRTLSAIERLSVGVEPDV